MEAGSKDQHYLTLARPQDGKGWPKQWLTDETQTGARIRGAARTEAKRNNFRGGVKSASEKSQSAHTLSSGSWLKVKKSSEGKHGDGCSGSASSGLSSWLKRKRKPGMRKRAESGKGEKTMTSRGKE
eukprot:9436733-Karenia_brevis.AAC.1